MPAKVLVVDDGHRAIDHSLAAELAELGYASVTASLEAAHDVLAVIARPAAILLQASSRRDPAYAQLSERLREQIRSEIIGQHAEAREKVERRFGIGLLLSVIGCVQLLTSRSTR